MVRFQTLAIGLALLFAGTDPAFCLDETLGRLVVKDAVEKFIVPAYSDFRQEAENLVSATDAFCREPTEEGLTRVRGRFRSTARSWGHIEVVREGPALEENRFERILFYPDRKSMGIKQVQALLAAPDETATDPVRLSAKSVAVQGLGAFEMNVFGSDAKQALIDPAPLGKRRCHYALSVAENMATIAAALENAWKKPGGTADLWTNPGPDNPVFRDATEAVQMLIGIEVHGLETIRDQRIAQFYTGPDKRKVPKAAIFWRSGSTTAMLLANVEGLDRLWKAAGLRRLLGENAGSLADSVSFDFKTAENLLKKLEQPSREKLGEPKYQAKLDFLRLTLDDGLKRIDRDIAGHLGFGAGFSFGDGD